MNLLKLFLLFWFFSILGWILEVIVCSISDKSLVNRGFLVGPYCPIYGCGGLLITLLLQGYEDRPLLLLFFSLIICSVLEYSTSFIMEKLFSLKTTSSELSFLVMGKLKLQSTDSSGFIPLNRISKNSSA